MKGAATANGKMHIAASNAHTLEDLGTYLFSKTPPAASQLETAVLGACMLDAAAFGLVKEILQADCFYHKEYQVIWEAFENLHDRNAPIDLLTVMEELKGMKKLDEVGGPARLASLTNVVASAANIEYHSHIIYQKWLLRDGIEKCSSYIRKFFDESEDPFDLRNDISDLLRVQPPTALLKSGTFGDAAEKGKLKPKLDRMCGGLWNRGEVCFFFGPPGTGKSIFAVQIADALSKGTDVIEGILPNECAPMRVLYIDFELNEQNITKRYSNQLGEVYEFDNEMLIRVHINEDFMDFEEKLDKVIHQQIENLILIHKPEALIVDNITWITSENSQDATVAARIMKKLIGYKKRYGMSLLVIAHAVKSAKNKHLALESSDMQGSAALEIFCDAKFGIKTGALDPHLKYLKQFKDRNEEMRYEEDNVLTITLNDKQNDPNERFLKFLFVSEDRESRHIASPDEGEDPQAAHDYIEEVVKFMYREKKGIRLAAKEMGYNKSYQTLYNRIVRFCENSLEWEMREGKPYPIDISKLETVEVTMPRGDADADIPF
jgi:KaiC/GvpD/RAD55 family RecA-like ATPase